MQTSFDFAFCCYFCLKYANHDSNLGTWINITYAVLFAILVCAFPFWSIFYHLNFEKVREDKSSFGDTVEDIQKKKFSQKIRKQLCKEFFKNDNVKVLSKWIENSERKQEELLYYPLSFKGEEKSQLKFLCLL